MIKKILIIFSVLSIAYSVLAAEINLENLKVNFIKGDYKSCIKEGEILLIAVNRDTKKLDELYYYLGLSYLKEGNLLRAGDIFDIISNEFKSSKFAEPAQISMGDVYRQKGRLDEAEKVYKKILSKNPFSKYRTEIEMRLDKIVVKEEVDIKVPAKTDSQIEAQPKVLDYKDDDLQIILSDELTIDESSGTVYSVQVGAFSQQSNAYALSEKLKTKYYKAFVVSDTLNDKTTYKVRVGKFLNHAEAKRLEKELSLKGYPTKIIP